VDVEPNRQFVLRQAGALTQDLGDGGHANLPIGGR
jgi:hypothetical protein